MRPKYLICLMIFFLLCQKAITQPLDNMITGKVVNANSNPAEGVTVLIYSSANSVFIYNGTSHVLDDSLPKTLTGEDGAWQLNDPKMPYGLYFYDETGYALFDSGQYINDSEIKLTPWSRVRGKLSVLAGGKADETITMSMINRTGGTNQIYFSYETKTSSNGEFEFDYMVEKEFQVNHSVPLDSGQRNRSTYYASTKNINTTAGEETFVSLWSFNSAHPYPINSSLIIFGVGTTTAVLLIFVMRRYANKSAN